MRHGVANDEKVQNINENEQKNIMKNYMQIDVNLINDKKEQPFKIREETNDFKLLEESIRILGITNPLQLVKKDNRYDIVEGHRRLYIAKKIGLKTVPGIIIEEDKDKNNLQLVDGNITSRQELLTSEKVKAYKLKYEAMANMGKSPKQQIAEDENTSVRTVERYLKLSSLTNDMLELIDEFETSKKYGFSMKVGNLFSDLSKENQDVICNYILDKEITIDEKQAKEIIKLDNITLENIDNAINNKPKIDKRKNISIPYKKVESFFSNEETIEERIEIIIKALENYFNKMQ